MNDKKSVILLPHGFQPEYEVGFVNGLVQNGLDVTLIGSANTLNERLDPAVVVMNLRGNQDPSRPQWLKALNMLCYWFRCYCYLLKNRGASVHVIGIFSTGNLWISLVEALLTRFCTGKFILTVHNLLPHDQHTTINAKLSKAIYLTASQCMVHTVRMRDALVSDFGVDAHKIVVVEHGFDRFIQTDKESRQLLQTRFDIPQSKKLILFFGNVAPYKGVDVLLDAFELLPIDLNAGLLIAGRCRNQDLKMQLRKQLKNNQNVDSVYWLDGYIPEEDVSLLFQAADVLVMPYRHIDQSGVVFMALAAGLPVVASDVGSLRNYIPEKFGAIVKPNDPQSLADGLMSILRLVPQRIPSGMSDQFLWSRTVKPIVAAYSKLQAVK